MATLEGLLERGRSLYVDAEVAPWVPLVAALPAVALAVPAANQALELDSMGSGTAVTMLNAGAGVGGFLALLTASRLLDDLAERRDIHFLEVVPAMLGVGLSGVAAALVLTPPAPSTEPLRRTLDRVGFINATELS